ncbi:hypothetical protein [Hyphococcus luteus]|uniref:hypothetical protein n=1 Tax=Hyphococcus luteus TaxID=2058213 RepID=UPI001056FF3A|nr:hypothetical protein [Marinicaulis flavus]
MDPEVKLCGEWHIALVDFIRAAKSSDIQNILPPDIHGAVGWVGILASKEDEVKTLIRKSFSEIGLHVLSVEDIQQLCDTERFEEFDEHLAENMRLRPHDDPPVVWGTLHMYYGEGEV